MIEISFPIVAPQLCIKAVYMGSRWKAANEKHINWKKNTNDSEYVCYIEKSGMNLEFSQIIQEDAQNRIQN